MLPKINLGVAPTQLTVNIVTMPLRWISTITRQHRSLTENLLSVRGPKLILWGISNRVMLEFQGAASAMYNATFPGT